VNQWRGDAPPVTDVWTITVAGPATGTGSVSVPVGTKSVSAGYANADTATTIAAALSSALANSQVPEFYEYAWNANANVVTGVAKAAGVPGVVGTPVVTAATGVTATAANPTPATGPNHADNPANWTRGVLPGTGGPEDVVIDGGPAVLYGLAGMYAGACTSTRFKQRFASAVGLPVRNTTGSADYFEYRTRGLVVTSGGDVHVGEGAGPGSPRLFLSLGSGQKLYVHNSGRGEEDGVPAVDAGSSSGPALLSVFGGQAGYGVTLPTAGTLTAATVVGGELLLVGTVASVSQRGGVCTSRGSVTTGVYLQGGVYTQDDGTIGGPVTADAGLVRFNHAQAGSIVCVFRGSSAGDPPALDLSGNDRTARDLGAGSSFTGGAFVLDPFKTATLTAVQFDKQSLKASDIGDLFQVTRS
jgi:hypothetical protein